MTDENGLTAAERELESVLKSLVPIAGGIDPVNAAYQAGRRSAGRGVRIWQGTAFVAMAACAFVWLPISKSHEIVPTKLVAFGNGKALVVPTFDQNSAGEEQAILDRGLDALPPLRLPDFSKSESGESF
ncbi:MAG: hypothetical protein ABSG31_17745 [Tepidisphaeraceae bacterium]|jgi:hypothetical protein